MVSGRIEFTELEKKTSATGESPRDLLAPSFGNVYVVSITRDACPACKSQKPKIEKLEKATAKKLGKKVVFKQVHVKYSPQKNQESLRSKSVLGHYFYPTNLILLRTADRGAIELYRNSSPRMSELERNIRIACKIASEIEKSMPKQKK